MNAIAEEWLTIADAAASVGVSQSLIYKLGLAGKVRRRGRPHRYRHADLRRWIADRQARRTRVWLARQARVNELRAEGLGIAAIAKRLGIRPATVCRWAWGPDEVPSDEPNHQRRT